MDIENWLVDKTEVMIKDLKESYEAEMKYLSETLESIKAIKEESPFLNLKDMKQDTIDRINIVKNELKEIISDKIELDEVKSKIEAENEKDMIIHSHYCVWCGNDTIDDCFVCNNCSKLHTLEESKKKMKEIVFPNK